MTYTTTETETTSCGSPRTIELLRAQRTYLAARDWLRYRTSDARERALAADVDLELADRAGLEAVALGLREIRARMTSEAEHLDSWAARQVSPVAEMRDAGCSSAQIERDRRETRARRDRYARRAYALRAARELGVARE